MKATHPHIFLMKFMGVGESSKLHYRCAFLLPAKIESNNRNRLLEITNLSTPAIRLTTSPLSPLPPLKMSSYHVSRLSSTENRDKLPSPSPQNPIRNPQHDKLFPFSSLSKTSGASRQNGMVHLNLNSSYDFKIQADKLRSMQMPRASPQT